MAQSPISRTPRLPTALSQFQASAGLILGSPTSANLAKRLPGAVAGALQFDLGSADRNEALAVAAGLLDRHRLSLLTTDEIDRLAAAYKTLSHYFESVNKGDEPAPALIASPDQATGLDRDDALGATDDFGI